jgi:hypothetical protein
MRKELSTSCYGDTEIAQQIIEELTTSCGFKEGDLRKFVREVAKSCPLDTKRLHKEIVEAEGKKEKAYQAIYKSSIRPL